MPFYLKETNVLAEVVGLRSVLIVPCRFCPAASAAVREKKPYIEPFRRLLRTEAYESRIKSLKRRLEAEGVEVSVFESRLLHQFVACMWTSGRRADLARCAAEFDGVVVLGCDAMAEAVRNAIDSPSCRVIRGMEIEGLMNVLPRMSFPLNVTLELQGVAAVGRTMPAVSESRP